MIGLFWGGGAIDGSTNEWPDRWIDFGIDLWKAFFLYYGHQHERICMHLPSVIVLDI